MANGEKSYVFPGLGELREGSIRLNYRFVKPIPVSETQTKTVFKVDPYMEILSELTGRTLSPGEAYVMKFFKCPTEDSTESVRLNFAYARDDIEQQFNSEVAKLSQNSHRNIARVCAAGRHDYEDGTGDEKALWYFVEEYCEGYDLSKIMSASKKRRGPIYKDLAANNIIDKAGNLNLGFIFTVMYDVAKGVKHLHRNSIAHGDLKPANIIVSHKSGVQPIDRLVSLDDICSVVTDLGSANELGNTAFYQLGSMLYRAPETIKALGAAKKGKIPRVRTKTPSDRWAIGVILYQLLTRKRPFAVDISDWSNMSESGFKKAREDFLSKTCSEQLVLPSRLDDGEFLDRYSLDRKAAKGIDKVLRKLLQRDDSARISDQEMIDRFAALRRRYVFGR